MSTEEKSLHESIVPFGPYRLDTANVRLWRGAQEVKLTGKAFTVLRYFVEHPGQLATKDDLFAAAWPETVISDATLVSCIQELRQALRDDAKKPRYIETVHRRGYRFVAAVTAPVPSPEFRVLSQEEEHSIRQEESQKPTLGLSDALRISSVEEAKEKEAERETETEKISPLNTGLVAQHSGLSTQHFSTSRFRQSFILAAVLLVTVIILTVQYLSRPILSTQDSAPRTDAVPRALLLPDQPSIVVVPFLNLSGDPGQEYFSDGITADITSTLSRLSKLFVISRTSAFTYKGKPTKVQDISKELGVRYVLEGSVRKTDDRLRIAVELIDATSDHSLWAEQYDRPLKNLFAVQDEIVQKIVTTLNLQLTVREQGSLAHKRTDNLEAYDAFLRGVALNMRFTKETTVQARQMFEKALTLDPQYADAYVMLGFTYHNEWIWRWSTKQQTLEYALALVQKAIALDDSLPDAHSLLSMIYALKQEYDQAVTEGEQAIALDPNNGDSYAIQAQILNFAGRGEEAIQMVGRAMRMNPRYPAWYAFELGWAYLITGQCDQATSALQEALHQNPNYLAAHFSLAISYLRQWVFQLSADTQLLAQAMAMAQRGFTLSDSLPWGHLILGQIYLGQKQYDLAMSEMERAIVLDPNDAFNYAALAETLSRVGRSEEALAMVEQARQHKPLNADLHLWSLGVALYLAGRPDEAIAPLKQYLSRYPNFLGAHLTLATVYSELGREAEARAEAAEVLRLNPKFSLEVHKERAPIKDSVLLEGSIAALRKAGLK